MDKSIALMPDLRMTDSYFVIPRNEESIKSSKKRTLSFANIGQIWCLISVWILRKLRMTDSYFVIPRNEESIKSSKKRTLSFANIGQIWCLISVWILRGACPERTPSVVEVVVEGLRMTNQGANNLSKGRYPGVLEGFIDLTGLVFWLSPLFNLPRACSAKFPFQEINR